VSEIFHFYLFLVALKGGDSKRGRCKYLDLLNRPKPALTTDHFKANEKNYNTSGDYYQILGQTALLVGIISDFYSVPITPESLIEKRENAVLRLQRWRCAGGFDSILACRSLP
jgi:uncharacterized hydantoinase/oxoprolinase family protein